MREDAISKIITQIKHTIISENFKIELLYRKLRHREKELLEKVIDAKMRKDNVRALMYAKELAMVRRVLRRISRIQLIFERALIRLETIEIFGSYKYKIVPLNSLISDLKLEFKDILPKFTLKLDSIEKRIRELQAKLNS
ncbi:MAG TPA: hypothetical protein EYH40_05415 [Desulfurococcales archaeon]|nr:hypothetical protein [Desulfurococcales archaeon]